MLTRELTHENLLGWLTARLNATLDTLARLRHEPSMLTATEYYDGYNGGLDAAKQEVVSIRDATTLGLRFIDGFYGDLSDHEREWDDRVEYPPVDPRDDALRAALEYIEFQSEWLKRSLSDNEAHDFALDKYNRKLLHHQDKVQKAVNDANRV